MPKRSNKLEIAIEMAREAGAVQMESFGRKHEVHFKGAVDIVTEIDKKCEQLIVGRIKKEFPNHDVLAEEGSGLRKNSEWRWIVDPLDGTVNYNHTYPFFGPSIALEYKGEIVLGVVYEPNRGELFMAEKKSGARLNDKEMRISETDRLQNSLLSTGFAYNVREGEPRNNLDYFERFIFSARATRRDGMAAGDLSYLACGRFDGFWELFLKPWDIAAGVLIIKEAGGRVTKFDGSEIDIYGDEILASNGLIHEEMMKVLK